LKSKKFQDSRRHTEKVKRFKRFHQTTRKDQKIRTTDSKRQPEKVKRFKRFYQTNRQTEKVKRMIFEPVPSTLMWRRERGHPRTYRRWLQRANWKRVDIEFLDLSIFFNYFHILNTYTNLKKNKLKYCPLRKSKLYLYERTFLRKAKLTTTRWSSRNENFQYKLDKKQGQVDKYKGHFRVYF
jgi:hypothetical protein